MMTVQDYNNKFLPICNKAESFIRCLNNALEKSDENARMQLKVIGWDKETELFIYDAVCRYRSAARDSVYCQQSGWWPKEKNK